MVAVLTPAKVETEIVAVENLNIEEPITEIKPVEAPPVAEVVVTPKPVPKPAPVAPTASTDPKMFIYLRESGNNPARWNSSGCVGLGQACPAQKLLAVCPDVNDYACQDAWFTNYAINRYGSWQGAYNHWQSNKWW